MLVRKRHQKIIISDFEYLKNYRLRTFHTKKKSKEIYEKVR